MCNVYLSLFSQIIKSYFRVSVSVVFAYVLVLHSSLLAYTIV